MKSDYQSDYGRAYNADCLDVMRDMAENSVDSIITDPPYALNFMGEKWDKALPPLEYCQEMLRVIKPGGYLLINGHPKTFHRLWSIIENSGWILMNTLSWLFGDAPGFGMNISKSIDKFLKKLRGIPINDPPVPEAKKFDGWHSGLKPGWEPVGLFMKPLDGTYVNNAMVHGLAGLNIDGCRLQHDGTKAIGSTETLKRENTGYKRPWQGDKESVERYREGRKKQIEKTMQKGRYPSNVALDETAAAMLDYQSGKLQSNAKNRINRNAKPRAAYGKFNPTVTAGYDDTGGASRFFYCPKAGPGEKNRGLPDDMYNPHATVKPMELVRWLCRLTKTPRGGIVLDPFAGQFTTGLAAAMEGRYFILCEQEQEYFDIGCRRLRSVLGMFY